MDLSSPTPSSSIYIENNESVDPSIYAALGLNAEKISHASAPDQGNE